MNANPHDRLWFDVEGLSEAEVCRLITAMNRLERTREEVRRRVQGLTEPRAARAVGFPNAYHDAEHEKRLDVILKAISLA